MFIDNKTFFLLLTIVAPFSLCSMRHAPKHYHYDPQTTAQSQKKSNEELQSTSDEFPDEQYLNARLKVKFKQGIIEQYLDKVTYEGKDYKEALNQLQELLSRRLSWNKSGLSISLNGVFKINEQIFSDIPECFQSIALIMDKALLESCANHPKILHLLSIIVRHIARHIKTKSRARFEDTVNNLPQSIQHLIKILGAVLDN